MSNHNSPSATQEKKNNIKENILMISLDKFYNNPSHYKQFIEIVNNKTKISLRIIDWFVTNYSKKNNISYNVNTKKKTLKRNKYKNKKDIEEDGIQVEVEEIKPKEKKENFIVFQRYKAQLKAYSKKRFDPFCRKDRVYNWGPEENITTTIGQLNFFKWAIENNIIKYIKENLASIESDMNENVRKHHKTKKKDKLANCGKTKRKELSTNASKSVQKLSNTIVLDFD